MKSGTIKQYNTRLIFIGKVIFSIVFLFRMSVLLAQDDIPSPPDGYDAYDSEIPHGSYEVVSYYSSFVGVTRSTRIYFPPGYSEDSTYNVLYLLHGIGGDINEWFSNGSPRNILDNLYARERIAPMIVVLPNGRAMEDDSPGSDIFAEDKVEGFANFEYDLLQCLIPFIDTTYPVKSGREARALAGLSMGGGQSLNFGLAHLDTFAWVGAFSPAPNTYAPELLIPNLEDTVLLSTLWISCGSTDGLLYISENTHNYMNEHNIEHYYLIEEGKGHDWTVWKPGLYHFTQRIFGIEPQADTISHNTTTNVSQRCSRDINYVFYNHSDHTINISDNSAIEKLSIYDLNGRLKLTESNSYINSLNISHLPDGIYILVTIDGREDISREIVKY